MLEMYKYIYYRLILFYRKQYRNSGVEKDKAKGAIEWLIGMHVCILLILLRFLFPDFILSGAALIIFIVLLIATLSWFVNKYFDRLNYNELEKKWGTESSIKKRNICILIVIFYILTGFLLFFMFYTLKYYFVKMCDNSMI